MTAREVDFSRLSLLDALDLAILIEQEAQERYEDFAHQMESHATPEAAAFFRWMAQNEARHGAALSERRRGRFGDAPRTVTRAQLWDVEAPEYDRARAFMTVREAMETALESERKAHAYFAGALPRIKDLDIRRLFEELRDEEVEHQALVREQLTALPPDSGPRPGDFADEPTAH